MSPEVFRKGYHAGYTAIAHELNTKYPEREKKVTRQQVHMWSTRRDRNGFPEAHTVLAPSGKLKSLYLLDDVVAWFESYKPSKGGGQRKIQAVDNTVQDQVD